MIWFQRCVLWFDAPSRCQFRLSRLLHKPEAILRRRANGAWILWYAVGGLEDFENYLELYPFQLHHSDGRNHAHQIQADGWWDVQVSCWVIYLRGFEIRTRTGQSRNQRKSPQKLSKTDLYPALILTYQNSYYKSFVIRLCTSPLLIWWYKFRSVEHSMRALATNETARLPPRMMAALTHGTSTQQQENQDAGQWDYDRPGPSYRYGKGSILYQDYPRCSLIGFSSEIFLKQCNLQTLFCLPLPVVNKKCQPALPMSVLRSIQISCQPLCRNYSS